MNTLCYRKLVRSCKFFPLLHTFQRSGRLNPVERAIGQALHQHGKQHGQPGRDHIADRVQMHRQIDGRQTQK